MSFQLNRNLKFTIKDYQQRPFITGDVVAVKYGDVTIIGRLRWMEMSDSKLFFIDGHGLCFDIGYARLAAGYEVNHFLYVLYNYGEQYYIINPKKKLKYSVKDITGKVLCFIPIPLFGLFWFMFYGVSREKLVSNSLLAGALFLFQILSSILGYMLMVLSL